jgi:uncharacterized phiE125 gp8 family phage protein
MDIIRTSPPAFPLVSPSELETWLRLDPNTDSATLDMLVTSATEIVEGITNRTIGASTYRIVMDRRATCYPIYLTNITAVVSVKIGTDTIDGWRLAEEGGDTLLILDQLPASPPIVTISAGIGDIDHVPDCVRHAIAILVSAGYNNREDIDEATFRTVERLCARYRRVSL